MKGLRLVAAAGALLVAAACSSSDGDAAETTASATEAPATTEAPTESLPPATEAPATTEAPPPATEAPATTEAAPPTTMAPTAIIIGEPDAEGVIAMSIDGDQLAPLFDSFMEGDDPFYLVHTQQEDIFVGVEMYTVFGADWTGQLGTFPSDCTTHGICVYLDPDGTGPLLGGGPGIGEITITQLDGGSIITIDDVTIVTDDGQVYNMSGLTLTG
jgi:hypothetical protein